MRKFAHARILGVDYGFVGLTKVAHRAVFDYVPRKGFIYIRSRAISSRTNDNFDTFPASELRKSWRTFIGKPCFVNHRNDDIGRKRGVIIDAALHEDTAPDGTEDVWIECLHEIDAKNFPMLAKALINNEIERTSMGTDVLVSECSFCGNQARTPDQYCAHVKRMKGQRLRRKNEVTGAIEDVLVHEICSGLSFFENSLLVEEPADPTAYTFGLDVRGILEEDEFMDKLSKVAAFKPKTACNVLVNDLDINDRWIMQRPGVLRQERDGMALVRFADGDQRMFLSSELTYTDEFFGGRVAASDGPSHSKPGGQPLNRGDRSFTIKRVGKDYEVWDQETGVQLGVVWRGRNVWHGQAMDGTYVVEDYPGSLQVACANVANYRGGTVASKTAAVELDELQRARFKGTSVDKDEDGYYCKTHRCRSESYESIDGIPDSAIEFIESTGAKMKTAGRADMDYVVQQLGDEWLILGGPWDNGGDMTEAGVLLDAYPGSVQMGQETVDSLYPPPRRVGHKTAAIDIGVPTEVRVPTEVETLRAPQCPVCDSDASWNSDGRCGVCGYLPPPKPFRAPDTDVAGRADQSGGWFDPELTRASPFKLDPAVSVNSNPVQSAKPTAKGQRLTQGVPMAQSVASMARQRVVADRTLADENARLRERLAKALGVKVADIDNPAQPVKEPPAQPAAPVAEADATIDVETIGGVVAPPDLSVPGNVTTPGQELPASEAPSTDVEAPVAGGSDVEDSTTEVKPDASGDGITPNAFGGDWINPGAGTIGPKGGSTSERATIGRIQSQVRDRIWASVRLARLRIESGISEGVNDDLELGRKIEGSAVTLEAIQAESSGLHAAIRARPAQQQARTARRAPSLAAGAQPSMVGLATRGEDEALFE